MTDEDKIFEAYLQRRISELRQVALDNKGVEGYVAEQSALELENALRVFYDMLEL